MEHALRAVLETLEIKQENVFGCGCVTGVAHCRRGLVTRPAREHAVEVDLQPSGLLVYVIAVIRDCLDLESISHDIGQGVLQLLQDDCNHLWSNVLFGDCISNQDGVVNRECLASNISSIGTFHSSACNVVGNSDLIWNCEKYLEVLLKVVWGK